MPRQFGKKWRGHNYYWTEKDSKGREPLAK